MENIVGVVTILDFIINVVSYVGSNPTINQQIDVGEFGYPHGRATILIFKFENFFQKFGGSFFCQEFTTNFIQDFKVSFTILRYSESLSNVFAKNHLLPMQHKSNYLSNLKESVLLDIFFLDMTVFPPYLSTR